MKEDIKNIVPELLEMIKELPDGGWATTSELFNSLNYNFVYPRERLAVHKALIEAAEKEGILLDMSSHDGKHKDLPYNLDFQIFHNGKPEGKKQITHITIKTMSGLATLPDCYDDKMMIGPDSIRYEWDSPFHYGETERKWSYRTTSMGFRRLFRIVCGEIEKILELKREQEQMVLTSGVCIFLITYADRSKAKRVFYLKEDAFIPCFTAIRQMVPKYEKDPAFLRYLDEEDEEEKEGNRSEKLH